MTVNDTWGYKGYDKNWKSPRTLVRMLVEVAGKGGNFLLNVGPRPDGTIPPACVTRLEAMGGWLERNGESIYGTEAGPFDDRLSRAWQACTVRGNRLYLHFFDWPAAFDVPDLGTGVKKVRLLGAPREGLSFVAKENGVRVTLPAKRPDPWDSVVVLELAGPPAVAPFVVDQATLVLEAREADLHGRVVRYDSRPGRESIGYWWEPGEWVSWPLRLRLPGCYGVEVTYGSHNGKGGGEYTVEVAGRKFTARARETGGWFDRVTDRIGVVEVEKAGLATLTVRIKTKPKTAIIDLKKVVLRRVIRSGRGGGGQTLK